MFLWVASHGDGVRRGKEHLTAAVADLLPAGTLSPTRAIEPEKLAEQFLTALSYRPTFAEV